MATGPQRLLGPIKAPRSPLGTLGALGALGAPGSPLFHELPVDESHCLMLESDDSVHAYKNFKQYISIYVPGKAHQGSWIPTPGEEHGPYKAL